MKMEKEIFNMFLKSLQQEKKQEIYLKLSLDEKIKERQAREKEICIVR